MSGAWRASKNLICSLILNLKDYISIKINEDRRILGQYKEKDIRIHPQALVISEWTQIIASFGNFQAFPTGLNALGYSMVINGKEEAVILSSSFADQNLPRITVEMTIGTTADDNFKSFRGSIGLVEIFTPGSVTQTSNHH